jgi:hypothetical protein
MNDTYRNQLVPTTIRDILRLVDDARHVPNSEDEEPRELSDFIEFLSAFNERFDQSMMAESLDMGSSGMEAEHTLAFEALCSFCERVEIPSGFGWTPTGSTLSAISPAFLRTGRYHEACVLPDNGSFLVRALGWRYLALQLALRRAVTRQQPRGLCLSETENYLVLAAKSQRRILNHMFVSHDEVAGNMTALAVTAEDHESFDSFLVTVSELSDAHPGGHALLSRARDALGNSNKLNIHHCILMADSISGSSMRSSAHSNSDHRIHLIGNLDEVRYIVFVSDVPDQSRPFVDPGDLYEGRFRLNRSRLKDIFFRRPHEEKGIFGEAFPMWSKTTASTTLDHRPASVFMSGRYLVTDGAIPDSPADGLISREHVARRFFGYKSPDFDL